MAAEQPTPVLVMAAQSANCDFVAQKAFRRPLGPHDVLFSMKYCGVCHTDVHFAGGHLPGIGGTKYPLVPGHELAGVCTAVGSAVTKCKVGDRIGVGCMVDSCRTCAACTRGDEQMCSKQVATYGGHDFSGRAATYPLGGQTMGGYSTAHVVHESFAVIIPPSYPLEAAGPVMCAGVTLYSPLKRYGAKAGTRVAIVGLGGLGGMGVKLAKAMGCVVTVISRQQAKEAAAKKMGADHFLASSAAADMAKARGSFDLVLNTIPGEHDWTVYSALLAPKGKQVMLGLNSGLIAGMVSGGLSGGRSSLVGSGIGSILETQEVIDLCAKHNITPDLKVVPVSELPTVYEALGGPSGNDSGLRYVLDIAGSLTDATFGSLQSLARPKLDEKVAHLTLGRILSAVMGVFCCCRCCR